MGDIITDYISDEALITPCLYSSQRMSVDANENEVCRYLLPPKIVTASKTNFQASSNKPETYHSTVLNKGIDKLYLIRGIDK